MSKRAKKRSVVKRRTGVRGVARYSRFYARYYTRYYRQKLGKFARYGARRKKRRVLSFESFSAHECPACKKAISAAEFASWLGVCLKCGAYLTLTPYERIALTVDEGSFCERYAAMRSSNILCFPDYDEKLAKAVEKTGRNEAVVCGTAAVNGVKFALAVMDPAFIMGSMGMVAGEKLVALIEYATDNDLPLVIFCASGGARMQEGMMSLIQMARVSTAVRRHSDENLLFVSVLTHPTTGGVLASFATQADIIIAEPCATIGFAGKRVVSDTIKQELPKGLQTAEFCLEHGQIDMIVARKDMRMILGDLLFVHSDMED